jgi:hypothetical protein
MISALEVKTMSILYSVETELANIEQNIVENAKQGNFFYQTKIFHRKVEEVLIESGYDVEREYPHSEIFIINWSRAK